MSIKLVNFGKRYVIKNHLARGGMADVYEAEFKSVEGFSKTVVIKKIISPYEQDFRWKEHFLKEAKIMALLTHSNIVQIYDFGQAESGYFLVLEYIEGGSLYDLKSHIGKLPKLAVLYMGIEILRGLSFAHRKGILHRDLSPSNILISSEGEIKISDFGIAKLISETLESTQFLQGKEAYMSPEQKRGMALTPASDIYSLSLLLYELMTGKVLLDKTEDEETAFLQPGLMENPEKRWSQAEAMERVLKEESAKMSESMTHREFQYFLTSVSFGQGIQKKRYTERLVKEEKNDAPLFRTVQKKAMVMGLNGLLLMLGMQAPAFYSKGYFSLNVNPWAEVRISNKRVGQTPLVRFSLPTGKHRIVVVNDHLNQIRHIDVKIEPNQEVKITLSF